MQKRLLTRVRFGRTEFYLKKIETKNFSEITLIKHQNNSFVKINSFVSKQINFSCIILERLNYSTNKGKFYVVYRFKYSFHSC